MGRRTPPLYFRRAPGRRLARRPRFVGLRLPHGVSMAVDIAQLLAFAVKNNASDLHLSSGVPPMIRVDGDMKRINMPPLSHKEVHSMVYDIMNDKQRKAYEEFFETDFSFEIPKLARFRVNAFNQNRGAGAVFRNIPSVILSLDDLNAPKIFRDLCMLPRGLVLVTGPTGSVTSTSPRGSMHRSRKILGAFRSSSERITDGMLRNTAPAPRFWLKALTRKRASFGISKEKSVSKNSS